MARKRRLKKNYAKLFDDPRHLFGSAEVTLWPNGEPEIWIKDPTGWHSYSIKASTGPAGLSLEVRQHIGAAPMTVRVYDQNYERVALVEGPREVTITTYNQDEKSQAFKRWYNLDEVGKSNGKCPL